jgi:flagellar hook-associated protein 1 FlgK
VPTEGGGRLSGWLRTLQTTLPDTLTSLDRIAESLVKEVNALHVTGHDLDGNTGVDFFYFEAGPPEKGVTASSIRLSDAVNNDSRAVVASLGDPSDGFNDSQIANDIFRLSEGALMNGGSETIETYAINLVTGIGATAKRASSLYESHAALANHVDAMAKGVSGVSLEEEMTDLIRYQQSFAAAARVLNSAEAMMESLLSM